MRKLLKKARQLLNSVRKKRVATKRRLLICEMLESRQLMAVDPIISLPVASVSYTENQSPRLVLWAPMPSIRFIDTNGA